MSQSRSVSYVLQPRAVGKAEVGAVHAGGQSAPAIAIEVVAGQARAREPQRQDPFGRDPFGDPLEDFFGRRRGRAEAPRLLMEAQASRTELKVGEPLVLTYWLYTQTSVADLQFKEAPQFSGFWVEDLERAQTPPSGEPATVEGQSYRRFPVLKKLLFPTKAGTLHGPRRASSASASPRTGFFDSGGSVERTTQAGHGESRSAARRARLQRRRRPLPCHREPRPGGGAARRGGDAALPCRGHRQPEVGRPRAGAHAAGGQGVPAPGEERSAHDGRRASPARARGSSWWCRRRAASLEIRPLAFSYFDPAAGRIVKAETAPLTLRVEGGTVAAGVAGASTPSAVARATGALPLRSDLGSPATGELSSRAILALAGLALVLHAGLWGAERLRGGSRRGEGRTASSRSVRGALRDLERAGRDAMSKEQAASLVEKALDEAFGRVPDADESERARVVRALLDDVHFVRYAPQLGRLLGQGQGPGCARGRGGAAVGVRPRALFLLARPARARGAGRAAPPRTPSARRTTWSAPATTPAPSPSTASWHARDARAPPSTGTGPRRRARAGRTARRSGRCCGPASSTPATGPSCATSSACARRSTWIRPRSRPSRWPSRGASRGVSAWTSWPPRSSGSRFWPTPSHVPGCVLPGRTGSPGGRWLWASSWRSSPWPRPWRVRPPRSSAAPPRFSTPPRPRPTLPAPSVRVRSVPVLETSGDWLHVEDNAGARGWAHEADVRRLDRAPKAPSQG